MNSDQSNDQIERTAKIDPNEAEWTELADAFGDLDTFVDEHGKRAYDENQCLEITITAEVNADE